MKGKLFIAVLVVCVLGFVFTGCSKKGEGKAEAADSPAPLVVLDVESNDAKSEARLIVAGDTETGSFLTTDDVDFYKFVLTETGKFTAWTESDIDFFKLDLIIYDEDGDWDDTVTGEYINIEDDEGDRMVEAILQPGIYFLELEGYEEGDYILKTQFEKFN